MYLEDKIDRNTLWWVVPLSRMYNTTLSLSLGPSGEPKETVDSVLPKNNDDPLHLQDRDVHQRWRSHHPHRNNDDPVPLAGLRDDPEKLWWGHPSLFYTEQWRSTPTFGSEEGNKSGCDWAPILSWTRDKLEETEVRSSLQPCGVM